MKPTLILFAKLPIAGRCKRRLSSALGYGGASRVYRNLLRHTMATAERCRGVRLVLSVDGDPKQFRAMIRCRGWTLIRQRPATLGGRMADALRRTSPGPALLIGSDILGITMGDLETAFTALHSNKLVFGPALDGGYWAIGLHRRDPALLRFQGVRWSTRHALADTLAPVAGRKLILLRRLSDVDRPADLTAPVLDRLSRRSIRPDVRLDAASFQRNCRAGI